MKFPWVIEIDDVFFESYSTEDEALDRAKELEEQGVNPNIIKVIKEVNREQG